MQMEREGIFSLTHLARHPLLLLHRLALFSRRQRVFVALRSGFPAHVSLDHLSNQSQRSDHLLPRVRYQTGQDRLP